MFAWWKDTKKYCCGNNNVDTSRLSGGSSQLHNQHNTNLSKINRTSGSETFFFIFIMSPFLKFV